jgi:hypoxanthine phosphoribosyltransferase
MKESIEKILIDEEELSKKIRELGEQITKDYKDKDLMLIGILKGAVIFMSELSKNIDLPLTMDFMAVSSYGNTTRSTGEVKIIKDLDFSVEGKDILIVEDIVDTGLTLTYLTDNLRKRGANSVKIATLLDKPEGRDMKISVDYLGFIVPDEFVVGYGLDYAEKYRNLPFVGTLKEEIYK